MGRPGHEIVFVYEARFVDPSNYERERFEIREPNFEVYDAVWRPLDDFRLERLALYPPDMLDLLERTPVA